MRWDFAQLVEGIEEFQRRSQRTQKSLADGSVGGATLLGSPTPSQLAGVPMPGVVTASGGAGMFTLLVAASNALDSSKERADYVCDGTDDQEEIAAALGATRGGVVWLSEGTFVVATLQPSLAEPWANATLQGCGQGISGTYNGTTLKHVGPSNDFALYNSWDQFVLKDLTIDAGSATDGGYGVYLSGDDCFVERVWFYSVGRQNYANLHLNGERCRVRDCRFLDTQNDAGGVYFGNGGSQVRGSVKGCDFENIGDASIRCSGGRYLVIGNASRFDNAAGFGTDSVITGVNSIVVGNIFEGDSATATISTGTGSQVANNVLL